MYRINPTTGAVNSFSLAGLNIANNPYGAQWLYGNGNLGISNNVTGRVYQIQVTDPTSATPTFTVLSRIPGPASNNNDGSSYPGLPVNLSVAKSAPATFVPGGNVAYSITLTNDGPGTSSGWVLNDTIPADLIDPSTTSAECTIAAGSFTCSGGSLDPGEAVTVTFSGGTAADQTDCLTNVVDILGNETDPDESDNTDDATTCPGANGVASFAVEKVAAPPVAHPGDTVRYTITVANTGSVDFTPDNPASFTDDLSDVIDDATVDLASIPPEVTWTSPDLSWAGPLAVGDTLTFTYAVTVDETGRADSVLSNVVRPGANGGCDVAAQCETRVAVAAFEVSKAVLTEPPIFPGQTIDYQITVANTGSVDYTDDEPASFTDDLTDALLDASLDEPSITGGATFASPILSWEGPLAAGTTTTITYAMIVNNPDTGDRSLVNTVVTPPDSGGDCPSGTDNPACTATAATMGFTVAKTVTVDNSDPAALVAEYTVTVTNIGQDDYTDDHPESFTDDLTGVLDDAVYNDDASAGAVFSTPTLSWTGALPVGVSVVVTYSVTVDSPPSGDSHLRNLVLPDTGMGGQCVTAVACATDTLVGQSGPGPVPPGGEGGGGPAGGDGEGLAISGTPVTDFAVIAALLICAGMALRLRRYRGSTGLDARWTTRRKV